jgi:enoyl-CoA hydratase/carnithine racemase
MMIKRTSDEVLTTLALDRPDKANALTPEMLDELDCAVAEAESNGTKVLVLTGRGKVFSAGADLDAARAGLTTHPVWERLSGRIAGFPGLTIAVLNGTCAGGAIGMVLACDLRIAVPNARIFYPVLKNGFLPQPSDPGRLVALCGRSRAKQILLGGQKIEAETALIWGLIDAVVPAEGIDAVIAQYSQDAQSADPEILRGIKSLCNQ